MRFHKIQIFKERGRQSARAISAAFPGGSAALIVRAAEPVGGGAGGANRDRTDDLLLAKQALSQLSYGPNNTGGSGWIRTTDLTLIRGAL